jgi:eukaryotic-like serine/threonine-protein kinase
VWAAKQQQSFFAVPFDPRTLQVKGGPVPVVEGALGVYGVSNAGTIAYLPGETERTSSGRTLVWVDRDGKEEPLGAQPANYLFPSISPDATRIALAILGDNSDIWIWDIARKTMMRLTLEKSAENQPIWTPDGKQVLFWSGREGKFGGIYRKQADGTGEVEKVVLVPDRGLYPYALSRDAKTLIAAETTDASAKWDISMLTGGDPQRKPLLQNPDFAEVQPRISPDGKWLAYVTAESGRSEVYVCSLPDVNKGRWQVSANGGVSPIWSPDGRELLYFSEDDGSVTSVPAETSPVFKPGTPKRLFSRAAYLGGGSTPGTPWDIHPDGKRFLMMRTPNAAALPQGGIHRINVILNWFEELKQRVPVK